MFRKRVAKLDEVKEDNPHAAVEIQKRLLQTAALSIALIAIIRKNGLPERSANAPPSNLPQYAKRGLKMPGPVSDSCDPEFGTGANAADVREGIEEQVSWISGLLGPELKNIVDVAQGEPGDNWELSLTERDMRLLRFCLNRALESI